MPYIRHYMYNIGSDSNDRAESCAD